MPMTNPVATRLKAGIDEDEAAAKATAPSGKRWTWRTDVQTDDDERIVGYCVISYPNPAGVAQAWGLERETGQAVAEHIARHDPARTLRRAAAYRAVIDRCLRAIDAQANQGEDAQGILAEDVLGIMAAIYSDDDV